MKEYLERAHALRNDPAIRCNCAQSVAIPFAQALGVEEDVVRALAANFGSGMKMGATCGAVTGAVMVLGLAGVEDAAVLQKLYRTVKERHDNSLDCRTLLQSVAQGKITRKEHCDGMVYELVELTQKILQEQGKPLN